MTEKILDIEERILYKAKYDTWYKQLQRQVTRKTNEVKKDWLERKCNENELLERQHNLFKLHKNVKETIGICLGRFNEIHTDDDDLIILDATDEVKNWKNYMTFLYNDKQYGASEERARETGPIITTEEVTNRRWTR